MRWYELINEEGWSKREENQYWHDMAKHWKSSPDRRPSFRRWPPSAKELLEVQRAVMQDPEWLAYWSRFGWTSFQQVNPNNYRFDKRTGWFRIENVPGIWYTPKNIKDHPEGGLASPERITVYIDLNGKVQRNPYGRGRYAHLSVILPAALYQIKDFAVREGKRLKAVLPYLTGTYYIRFGRWRENEQSKNHLTGEMEHGVSVYPAEFDIDEMRWAIDPSVDEAAINGTLQSLIYERDKRIFLVQGTEIAQLGSDGEPLLKDVKLIKQLAFGDVYVPGIFDPKEDLDDL